MKQSNLFSLGLLLIIFMGLIYSNLNLKNQYLNIDLNDIHKNYLPIDIESFNNLKIIGSNGYPIVINHADSTTIKVLRSRQKHFNKTKFKDTLNIEFTGSNISMHQALMNNTPPGIIISVDSLSSVEVYNTLNRINGFTNNPLKVKINGTSLVEFSNNDFSNLSVSSKNHSQYIFKNNNHIDSLILTMKGKSLGQFKDVQFSFIKHTLGDSASVLLYKSTFEKI